MTEPTLNLRGEVDALLASAHEDIHEVQNELEAFDNIEHVRALQHSNQALIDAGNAFLQAWSTRNYMRNVLNDYDHVVANNDILTERLEEYDLDDYVRLQAVERDHKHNTAIVNKMRDELALLVDTSKGIRRVRRYIEKPRA